MGARHAVALAGAFGVLASCGPGADYTPQVKVTPGAAARALWIGHGGDHAGATPIAAAARVRVMTAADLLGGPNAIGRAGDLILQNDEVVFVIDQLAAPAQGGGIPWGGVGFAESGGNIVDAADARARKDELGQIFTSLGTFPSQGVYDSLKSGASRDGAAWVEASGHLLNEPALAVTTRYTLRPGDRALLIETHLRNHGDHAIGGVRLGDAVQWGGAEKFSPDRGRGFHRGYSSGSFLGGIGRYVSYALTTTDGQIDAVNGPSWSDTLQSKTMVIDPGKGADYARVFIVGPRADVSGLVAELTKASGGSVGTVDVALTDDTGARVPAPDYADVEVQNPLGKPVMDLRASQGVLGGELPPGKYLLAFLGGGGRASRGPKVPVTVQAGETAKATLEVSAPGRLHAACVELAAGSGVKQNRVAVPCKATLVGLGGSSSPDFGPPHMAGPARNQVTTPTGVVDVAVAPGRYRLVLSRGPEYALATVDVDVKPGALTDACGGDRCVLRRVVDTTGYVAADFHQHTMLGIDAPTSTRDRVIGNVAEGVEVAVASEHNVVADLMPVVRDLHVQQHLVEIPGDELTSDASPHPWGHANVFPLVPDPDKPRGGAPAIGDGGARALFEALRRDRGEFVLQINHPRSGSTGYFDRYRFDRATGVGKDPGYDPGFDALEVWNGRNVGSRDLVLPDALALLRTGHPVTLTGNTDTHGMVRQEAGYPRTYVRVGDDRDLDAWNGARTRDLVDALRVRRDVVVTNGPFLRVTAGGARVGGVARAKGGKLRVQVHVECAPWVHVDGVSVLRAVGPRKKPGSDAASPAGAPAAWTPVKLRPARSGAMTADVVFSLDVDQDDAFVVLARGKDPLSPVLAGDPDEVMPFAFTGALWVDADGDGKSLGR